MKFHLEKAIFENAIGTAIRAVPSKSSIPALEGLLLEAEGETLTISAYDLKTAIRTRCTAEVEQEGRVVLNAKLFSEIIRKMPQDVVTVDCGDDLAAKVTCGQAHYSIMAFAADEYPDMPDVGDTKCFDMSETALASMIGGTIFAVSTNEQRPVQTGALFDLAGGKLNVVASDGFRVAIRSDAVDTKENFEFVVPGTALSEVERMCGAGGMVRIAVADRHVMFYIGSTELISRRLEGQFLNYKGAIPQNNPITVTADAKELMQSLDRVSVVINEKIKSPVRCNVGGGEMRFSAKTAIGAATDKCKIGGDGKDLEIGFNHRYLYDTLRFAAEQKVNISLNTNVTPAVITPTDGSGKFLYMVLPVRLKTK